MSAAQRTPATGQGTHWLSWVLGAAFLAAVILAAVHYAEQQAFVRLVQQASPAWLVAAAALQLGTYAAQGGVWRRVAIAADYRLPWQTTVAISLAKLFADQALPSAGLSGSVLVAQALEQRRIAPGAIRASVVINVASYQLAYVLTLAVAIAILIARREANAVIIVTAAIFLLFSIGLSAAVLALAGRPRARPVTAVRGLRGLRTTLDFVAGADARLVRGVRVIADTTLWQIAIVVLDAATMWVLIRALGTTASPGGVFAAFMVASLFRTMGIVPGGLGTFEATSVLMLRRMDVDLAVALSATLLFRGLSFWLPMPPGYWLSRRITRGPAGARVAGRG
jgi:Mg2+-importing ATPase